MTPVQKTIHIQVVYALPDRQHIIDMHVDHPCRAVDAVKKSGMLEKYPELDTQTLRLGIFGKSIANDTMMQEGVRVEIYRPLIADPKESRRERARLAKKHSRKTNSQ